MKRQLKSVVSISALAATVLAPVLLFAGSASAKPTGTQATYVGAGVAAGLTNGGQDGDAATFGGNIQGRFAVPNTPVSLRGAVLFSDETSAIIPMISYDVPVTNNANIYLGAGYSFVEANGQPTPLGNQDAPVLALGAEAQIGQNVVVYGDTKLGIEAYQNSPASAVSVQGGVGYRFR
ncbi:outer membrane beta-barrel protein [Lyngbya aestuarii]|uniref:outer membrane beta-barrel protein n=1 Tax=Lyngbya aestuarii TaxID=118322 RepID=UPI00403E231C